MILYTKQMLFYSKVYTNSSDDIVQLMLTTRDFVCSDMNYNSFINHFKLYINKVSFTV